MIIDFSAPARWMCLFLFLLASSFSIQAQEKHHTFSLGKTEFLLDGKPLQIIGGELHPSRIPKEYWLHRIKMAKAMGCNTIALYVFWNYHEPEKGTFDFSSENRDLAEFIRLCQKEKMWVLFRPGPYVCGEWDFGGLPPYLLTIPDIKIRCMDPRYIAAVDRYIEKIAEVVKPLLVTNGGPVIMVQVENEYGSFGNDKAYMEHLKEKFISSGINVPLYTADGATPHMLEAGALRGAAIGLDSGNDEKDFAEAEKLNYGVPVFSSETYPGWLTHWGEKWAKPDTTPLLNQVRYLLENKKSFNFYVLHGGTNFGFTAGANAFSPTQYQPDITSYDYDSPINEQGRPTEKYFALRDLIKKYARYKIPDVPQPVPVISISDIKMVQYASLWDNLPEPVVTPQPQTMESLGQYQGYILYKTKLLGHKSGKLTLTEPHDYATIFLNGKYVGFIARDGGNWTIDLPASNVKDPVLEILVEGMGRINFAQYMIDRKGITDRVTLNGMTLMNWETYRLPFTSGYVQSLKSTSEPSDKPGIFFKGIFNIKKGADTFIDLTGYKKGVVWVNGHNLGRFWDIGPQKRLYCPASFLNAGKNEILIFDTHQTQAKPVSGKTTLD